jgi:pyruvate dehydrogenase E2 component (dihydrolipoamide acetyltransferase)
VQAVEEGTRINDRPHQAPDRTALNLSFAVLSFEVLTMPIEITMPRLSDTMQQGTVVRWNVKEGQKVASGDVIADIETDKATMELQSFDEGTVAALSVPEGQTVPVGTVIAMLAGEGESVEEARKAGGAETSARKPPSRAAAQHGADVSEREDVGTAVLDRPGRGGAAGSAGPGAEPKPDRDGARIFASPLARKIARESGVDLQRIEGTGPSGRITSKDVEAAAGASPAARREASRPAAERAQPAAPPVPLPAPAARLEARRIVLSNMRRTIARRLVESKQNIPHYQVTVEVDLGALLELRRQLNEQLESQGLKLSVNDFIVRACALAMHQHPYVNSRWSEEGGEAAIDILEDVNVGVAIALPMEKGGGLVVATLPNTDRMGLRQISSETRRLAEKARSKGLSMEEMADSTFTISNLGMYGVEHFTAIINPPNAAILAVGAAVEKPVVRGGQIVIGHRMAMTMSSDHRLIDGAMAAQYLATVKQMLEKPATLLV